MANFVLVHGAYHGGWCWARVLPLLRARGHLALAPTLTGLGERAHLIGPEITLDTFVQDVAAVLETEELHDVVLVGHSFAGSAISGAADRMPGRIRHLVYLDSVMLEGGQCVLDTLSPDARADRISRSAGTVGVAPPPPRSFGVPDGTDADWLRRRMTPQPWGSFTSPLRLRAPPGNGLPATYVACTDPVYQSLDWARRWVRGRAGFAWRELPAGHDCMVTNPAATAALLEELAT